MLSQSMFTVYEVPNAAKLVNIDKGVNVFPVIYSMEELEQYMALVKIFLSYNSILVPGKMKSLIRLTIMVLPVL